MNPKLTPVESKDDAIECFDVQLDCLGGAPVSGYFGRPKAAKPKSLPAILYVHGAGVRGSSLGNAVSGAGHGMLSMDINAHGIPNGKPAAFLCRSEPRRTGQLSPQGTRESRDDLLSRDVPAVDTGYRLPHRSAGMERQDTGRYGTQPRRRTVPGGWRGWTTA